MSVDQFRNLLFTSGVHEALGYLSHRTPHRYTGIYKFNGEKLDNIALYDSYNPKILKGEDAPLATTYCSLVKKQNKFEITDAETDMRVKGTIITPVISYCGVLIKDLDGKPFGTLCHFDMRRCEETSLDFPLLEEAAQLLYSYLEKVNSKVTNVL